MNRLSPRLERALKWLLFYFWSVVPVALLIELSGLEYDGGLGLVWFLAMAYASPVVLLAEPFSGVVDTEVLAACYLLILIMATGLYLTVRQRRPI